MTAEIKKNKINNRRKLQEHHILPAAMTDRSAVIIPTADITTIGRADTTEKADITDRAATTEIRAADIVMTEAATTITDKADITGRVDTTEIKAADTTGKADLTEIIRAVVSADQTAEETLTSALQRKLYLFQESR